MWDLDIQSRALDYILNQPPGVAIQGLGLETADETILSFEVLSEILNCTQYPLVCTIKGYSLGYMGLEIFVRCARRFILIKRLAGPHWRRVWHPFGVRPMEL